MAGGPPWGGRTLASTTIDGWQQGYVVPIGAAGTVRLDFAPDRPVRWGMVLGGLLALALVAMTLVPERRRPGAVAPAGRGGRLAVALVGVGCIGLVAGWWGMVVLGGVGVVGALAHRRLSAPRFAVLCVVGTVLSALAAGAVLVSGHYASQAYRADQPAAQLLVVAALSFLVLSLSVPSAAVQRVARPSRAEDGSDGPTGSAAARGSGS